MSIDTTIYTDSNLDSWGQFVKNSETGGMWKKQEQALYINALKFLGAKLGFLCFFKDNKDIKHIRVMMGSNTAVALVRIRSNLCDDIAFNIRKWLTNENYGFQQPTSQGLKMIEQKKTPGCLNGPQIYLNGYLNLFERSSDLFERSSDLFASRTNHQLSNYVL